jgi:hypothetical protein
VLAAALLVAVPATAGIAASRTSADEPISTVTVTTTTTTTTVGRYHGVPAQRWAAKFRHRTRQLQAARHATKTLRHTLLTSPTVSEAIGLSCAVFGFCSTLWRKAECESHLSPVAHNSSGASGLFQFLPSTWRSTPFGGLSIWSPYANAMAAGWMHAHGRGGEWVCG